MLPMAQSASPVRARAFLGRAKKPVYKNCLKDKKLRISLMAFWYFLHDFGVSSE